MSPSWHLYTKVVFWGMTSIQNIPAPAFEILEGYYYFRMTSPTYPGNDGCWVYRQLSPTGTLAGAPGAHESCDGCADCDAENHFGNQDEPEDPAIQ